MHNSNGKIRKFHLGVQLHNPRILPILHDSQIDLRQQVTGKVQLGIAGQVIDGHKSDQDYGNREERNLRTVHLCVSQEYFAAAEVSNPLADLSDALGGSQGQVSYLDAFVCCVKLAGPSLIEMNRHIGAGPDNHDSLLCRSGRTQP